MSLRHRPPEAEGSWASDEATRRVMTATRGRDTRPEKAVRSAVHALGLRYRVGAVVTCGDVRVRPDLVFKGARVAVFVDGCFWHSCPEHGDQPRTNTAYWRPKLEANVARDRRVDRALQDNGWRVVRAWEHESPVEVAERVRIVVADARRRAR
ncbi:MAG TPA: very short patch repair endonuclease [Solirubrobacterales bacterium]